MRYDGDASNKQQQRRRRRWRQDYVEFARTCSAHGVARAAGANDGFGGARSQPHTAQSKTHRARAKSKTFT